ncbi:hypothetical protein Q6305_29220, partial [Klebsiella pneumoniae]
MFFKRVMASALDQQIRMRVERQMRRDTRNWCERGVGIERIVIRVLGHDHGVKADIRIALEQFQHYLPD